MARTNRLNTFQISPSGSAISVTFTAFTPTANGLLVAVVATINPTEKDISAGMRVTGGSIDWTRRAIVAQSAGSGYTGVLEIWTAPVGASPASCAINVASDVISSGDDAARVCVSAFDFAATDVNVSNPVVQAKTALPGSSDGAYSFTLDSAPASTSILVAARDLIPTTSEDFTATPGSGWTEIYDGQATSGYGDIQTQQITGVTSTTIAWDNIAVESITPDIISLAAAIELRAPASGALTTTTTAGVAQSATLSGSGSLSCAIGVGIAQSGTLTTRNAITTSQTAASTLAGTASGAAAITNIANATLGAHTMATVSHPSASDTLTTSAITTQSSGSALVIVASRSGADSTAFVGHRATDNKGNTFVQQGPAITFVDWPICPVICEIALNAAGGSGHTVTYDGLTGQECTAFVVEIINGNTIADYQQEVVATSSTTHTTPSVTVSGPATILSFCWGGLGTASPEIVTTFSAAYPYTKIEEQQLSYDNIQGAVACRDVSEEGTYSGATWTLGQSENAVLYTIAILHGDAKTYQTGTAIGVSAVSASLSESTAVSGTASGVGSIISAHSESGACAATVNGSAAIVTSQVAAAICSGNAIGAAAASCSQTMSVEQTATATNGGSSALTGAIGLACSIVGTMGAIGNCIASHVADASLSATANGSAAVSTAQTGSVAQVAAASGAAVASTSQSITVAQSAAGSGVGAASSSHVIAVSQSCTGSGSAAVSGSHSVSVSQSATGNGVAATATSQDSAVTQSATIQGLGVDSLNTSIQAAIAQSATATATGALLTAQVPTVTLSGTVIGALAATASHDSNASLSAAVSDIVQVTSIHSAAIDSSATLGSTLAFMTAQAADAYQSATLGGVGGMNAVADVSQWMFGGISAGGLLASEHHISAAVTGRFGPRVTDVYFVIAAHPTLTMKIIARRS